MQGGITSLDTLQTLVSDWVQAAWLQVPPCASARAALAALPLGIQCPGASQHIETQRYTLLVLPRRTYAPLAQDDDDEEEDGRRGPAPSPSASASLPTGLVSAGASSPPRHFPRAQDTMPSFPLVDYDDDDDEDEVCTGAGAA